jgi:hypothetical protein
VHGGLGSYFPNTEEGVYFWLLVATIGYVGVAGGFQWWATNLETVEKYSIGRIFDGITFSSSLLLLGGLIDQPLLTALGSTKPFLFFAGLAGAIYSLHALRPRPQ